ncbi:MAG: polyribonucleotide nucleotidyltransferase [Nitrospirae bacterium]|nr:polyribonucleotide nucleotidyltransferase [Nitrospirota bacterium]
MKSPFQVELQIRDKKLILETGLLAKQADGAIVARYGDTILLTTAVSSRLERDTLDFIPLTIDYQEKAYAAGKIPGGFLKREGRPSEKETLTSRLTDRSIRPLFKKGYRFDSQGISNVISYGDENISDILSIISMSAAFVISEIPFDEPVGAVRVGRINEEFIVNPTLVELEDSDLNLIVSGTAEAVIMVEGSALELSEKVMLSAIEFAHGYIKQIVELQNELRKIAGKPKREFSVPKIDEALVALVKDLSSKRIQESFSIPDKLIRQRILDDILHETITKINTDAPDTNKSKEISSVFFDIEKDMMRDLIINENRRADGRTPDQIRKISCIVGYLPKAHGSAVFTRGETQSLTAVTLGTSSDEQRVDSLDGDTFKSFILHYNFPPFSVGEVKPIRQAGRREIGHGALAERGLRPILPSSEVFPYTIRVVSDILESNGSSSMATVCCASLAMMDAGIPIKEPVAGIAMGLIKDGDKIVILTDILGVEDHLGDMDFKVTGTKTGITAFQMDVKIKGVGSDVMEKAVEHARLGRLHILGKITEAISGPRENLSSNAPRIVQMQVKPEKVRDIIGAGGKIIRSITEQTGAKIDINDDGLICIASADEESLNMAINIIKGIVEEPEIGKIYRGEVKKIMDFGAFVEVLPGTDGLLHISQISDARVAKVTDELNEGDMIFVKILDIDRGGKIKLSRKGLTEDGKEVGK